jgi:lipopolysaccharide cholinephosphotransferase
MSETVKLTSETLRELQLKQLDMLKYFRDFCDKNSLRFYLIGGGLIGALRNGGFVPWDDDVDVLMPRNDYEKLNKLWKEQHADGRFRLLKTDDEMFTGNIFITITDTNYTMVKSNQTEVDIPHGLVLDVFPLDVCPNSRFARKMQFVWTLLYSLFLAQVVPENHGGLVGFGSKILLGIFRGKKLRNRIWRFCERKMTQYKLEENDCVTELCSGPHWMKIEYPKHIYDGVDYVTFEGLKMPCMSGYDEYLTMVFGNYMTEPPKEEQVPHHDIAYLDLNSPCCEYDSKRR